MKSGTYRWAGRGDINAFFGLMLDNMTDLVIMAALLSGFGIPSEIIYHRMVPGTAIGVLLGGLAYTWMAHRLAQKTGRDDVCAMPLGLDTPSTFVFCLSILGPAFLAAKEGGLSAYDAGIVSWQIGMAVLVLCGVIKLALSFAGPTIRRLVPRAGLLGSIAGIALVLIAFIPAIHVFSSPLVGFLSLGVILVAVVGRRNLPGGMPGALVAVVVGTLAYYFFFAVGVIDAGVTSTLSSSIDLRFSLPLPTLAFVSGLSASVPYLPLAIPWAVATVIGGIDCTESAAAAGDDYDTRGVLLTEGAATLIAGLCGGVIQSTPYIGHPAYKEMGGRAAYTLATALFIGLGGIFGYIPFFLQLLPTAATAPILIFIGLEITAQAFTATPAKHAPAIALAFIPTIAYLITIEVGQALFSVGSNAGAISGNFAASWQVITLMANGFIITAMIWGGATAQIIDGDYRRAALSFGGGALCVLVGVIHSPKAGGEFFWPWSLTGTQSSVMWSMMGAYLLLAAMLGLFWYLYQKRSETALS